MKVIKAGFENSYGEVGCSLAPDKVIESFGEVYVSEDNQEILKNFLEIIDLSPIISKDNKKPLEALSSQVYSSLLMQQKIFVLGGDHSISSFSIQAFHEACKLDNLNPFLIVFDAHADCKFINDFSQDPTNLQWLRKIIMLGFPTSNIILVGLRRNLKEEIDFLKENNIRSYSMKDLVDFQEICDIIMELSNKFSIYLSIDIDVVDAAFVPGTNNPEIGGLTSRQLIYFVQRLNLLKNLKVIDLCEINPKKDFNNITINLGAKLLGEVVANNLNK